jgi:hypothetical protein
MQSATAFSARDFTAWATMGGHRIEEEDANEILLGEVANGRLREIGPGVYALKINGTSGANRLEVPLQETLWPEEVGR